MPAWVAHVLFDSQFISRRAVANGQRVPVGYELALHMPQGTPFPAYARSAKLYFEWLTDEHLDAVLGDAAAHVDVDASFVMSQAPRYPGQVPVERAHRLVLELQRDAEPEPGLVRSINGWRNEGCAFAIDDVQPNDPRLALMPLVKYVKLDFAKVDPDTVAEVRAAMAGHEVQIIALGVGDRAAKDRATQQGATLFQGYWVSAPGIVPTSTLNARRDSLLLLVSRLYDPNVNNTEIEKLITRDPALTVRLLQIANSAIYRRNYPVDSVRQALVLLGLRNVANWISLILMSHVEGAASQSLVDGLTRAKLCELLAREVRVDAERMFTVGLLSSFDKVVGVPLTDLIRTLRLSEEASAALLHRRGPMGLLLHRVEAHERQDWRPLSEYGLTPHQINEAWIAAVSWADQAVRNTTGSTDTPVPVLRR